MNKIEKFEFLKSWYDKLKTNYEWEQDYKARQMAEDENYDSTYQDKAIEDAKFKMEFIEKCLNDMLK